MAIYLFFSLVRAAFLADADRLAAVLFFAAARACLESAAEETEVVGSFFNALILALDLFAETLACVFPFSVSR